MRQSFKDSAQKNGRRWNPAAAIFCLKKKTV
jgi:hypothetical protein